jgi:hypothetical protein
VLACSSVRHHELSSSNVRPQCVYSSSYVREASTHPSRFQFPDSGFGGAESRESPSAQIPGSSFPESVSEVGLVGKGADSRFQIPEPLSQQAREGQVLDSRFRRPALKRVEKCHVKDATRLSEGGTDSREGMCVTHCVYHTAVRSEQAFLRHSPSSRPGYRHMRRQRSAGRDSRHCHEHGGDTYGIVLPTTTPPGRFGRPRRNSVGNASSPLYKQAGQVGSRHMLIPA